MIGLPRVRPLDPTWIEHEGQPALVLRDRLGLAETVVVPGFVAAILALCDGSRDPTAIQVVLEEQAGQRLPDGFVRNVVDQLTEALILESPAVETALERAILEYRSAEYREPALTDGAYPADPRALTDSLIEFARSPQPGGVALGLEAAAPTATPRGLISPHIDYHRGGPLYARTWLPAARTIAESDLVIIFGTDHVGGPGRVTLTRHDYATPYGRLPTDRDLVATLTNRFGDDLFAEEIHHRNEHSIELAAVWLHHVLGGKPISILPVLCGSFHHYTALGQARAADDLTERFVETLRDLTANRRVFAVAAADLAHVGPNFGDPNGWGLLERRDLATADRRLAEAIARHDADSFLNELIRSRDATRICGLPPIYLTLRYLGAGRGELAGYAHCPADADDQSLVSIGGFWLE